MSNYLLNTFKQYLNIKIQPKHVKQLKNWLIYWESYRENSLTLNSQLIGVHSIAFTAANRREIFDIFGIEETEVAEIQDRVIYTSGPDSGKPVIDRSFNVSGDTLNVFITWLIYLGYSSDLSARDKESFVFYILKIWHYRFFTSLINRNFRYKCKEEVMQAAIDRLTNQSDIIKFGTWSKVIEEQCRRITDPKSIHINTMQKYNDDKKVFYLITDTQTRIRDKFKRIVEIFRETKDTGDIIKTYSATGSDIDASKIVMYQVSLFDTMTNNLSIEILNTSAFIEDKPIQIIASVFKSIRPDMLRYMLTKFSELAVSQSISGELDKIETHKNTNMYIGARALITNLIQKSYRYCIVEQVDMKNQLGIILKLKNIYSSSRIVDPGIISVKNSVDAFVEEHSKSKRTATNSSLKIAFVLYVIFKSFKYL